MAITRVPVLRAQLTRLSSKRRATPSPRSCSSTSVWSTMTSLRSRASTHLGERMLAWHKKLAASLLALLDPDVLVCGTRKGFSALGLFKGRGLAGDHVSPRPRPSPRDYLVGFKARAFTPTRVASLPNLQQAQSRCSLNRADLRNPSENGSRHAPPSRRAGRGLAAWRIPPPTTHRGDTLARASSSRSLTVQAPVVSKPNAAEPGRRQRDPRSSHALAPP